MPVSPPSLSCSGVTEKEMPVKGPGAGGVALPVTRPLGPPGPHLLFWCHPQSSGAGSGADAFGGNAASLSAIKTGPALPSAVYMALQRAV